MAVLDEGEAYRTLVDALHRAASCCRSLALATEEPRWILVGEALHQCRRMVTNLATKRRQPFEHPWLGPGNA